MPDITGKKVAILATNGFEESELLEPKRMLEEAGAHTEVVAPQTGEIKG
jgi:protease I